VGNDSTPYENPVLIGICWSTLNLGGGLRYLFFDSRAPVLVFSMTYLRGKLAPSAVLPILVDREPGLPPQISHEKTTPSASAELTAGRQSLRKDIATLPWLEHQNYFSPINSCEGPENLSLIVDRLLPIRCRNHTAPICREITIRCTSEVPSPISRSF
jgi:hypothetical protein